MPRLYFFREKVEILSASTGTNNLDHDQVKQRRIYHYERITVKNKTSDFTKLILGVLSENEIHEYQEQHNGRKDILYVFEPETPIAVQEPELFRAQLTGCTSADNLVMWVAGRYEIFEGPKAEEPVEEEEAPE